MKYILDFDEVLFNTTALKQKMDSLGFSESEREGDVLDKIIQIDPEFDLRSLVFPGALSFLQKYGKDCIVVSSASSVTVENNTNLEAQVAFQQKKIALSGVEDLVQSICVVGVDKTEALSEIQNEYGNELVFVDDREKYVKEARELGIESVWMDREGKGHLIGPEGVPTMLEFPRVGSFKEFAKYANSWKQKN